MLNTGGPRPGTKAERTIAFVMLGAAVLYLIPFIPRGWFPHDEGMIGQSAERVLLGGLPHVDYEEPYTGGLAWIYAGLFKLAGIDLVNVRWLLFGAASLTQFLVYAILRRHFAPIGAAVATWVALAWSFPNYFAGLPSWWVLMCALVGLWALIRYFETTAVRYVALAGLAVGIAFSIKQTGAYLLVPVVMSVWIGSQRTSGQLRFIDQNSPVLRLLVGLCALMMAVLIMRSRLLGGEIIYLLVPIAATSVAFSLAYDEADRRRPPPAIAIAIAGAATAFTVGILLIPYAMSGHLNEFINGVFLLPQRRLTFAAMPLPSAAAVLSGVLMVVVMLAAPRSLAVAQMRGLEMTRWGLAAVLVWLSLHQIAAYQFVWQSTRSIGALLPVIGLAILAVNRPVAVRERRILFASLSMLAWASLVQFPFGAPIYFCYVAPLAVLTVAAIASGQAFSFSLLRPWAALLLVFAVLSMNRGSPQSLGLLHRPAKLDAALALPRADLRVDAADALIYQRTIGLVNAHLRGGQLVAGPDCPEIYFLTGQFSPTGALFDFFLRGTGEAVGGRDSVWLRASVVVVNHEPSFSPVVSPQLTSALRSEFRHGEIIGKFEVRWR